MDIYIDVLFLVNFGMDLLLLCITGAISKKSKGLKWTILASGIMAAGYCLCLVFGVPNVLASCLLLLIGVYVAFRPKLLIEYLKLLLYTYITAFAAGGLAFALSYAIDFRIIAETFNNVSLNILIPSVVIFYVFFKIIIRVYSESLLKKQVILRIKIEFGSLSQVLTVLVDTGNTLWDPITKKPVLIAEFTSVQNLLPPEIKHLFLKNLDIGSLGELPTDFRIRLIPFNSVGKKDGIMIGFSPDKISIIEGKLGKSFDAIVGICSDKLSKQNNYQGLLSPQLIA